MDSLVTIKADAELLAARLEKLENGMDSYEQIKLDAIALSSQIAAMENADPGIHSHFKKLLQHPNLHAAWSLRENAHYLNSRGGTLLAPRLYPNGVNPGVRYDPDLDACRVKLPDFTNELAADGNNNVSMGNFMLWWPRPSWGIGDKLVIRHEMLISQAMHDLSTLAGLNGRSTPGFKFTNLCRAARNGKVTYELFTIFNTDPLDTRVYIRGYGVGLESSALEGIIGRSQLSSSIGGTAFDVHPGPDSINPSNANPPHPTQFKIRSNLWVDVVYELERVAEGTRVKLWMADDETDAKLIVASPANPQLGFLTSVADPIEAFYVELDSSQETTYATPQPERWCAFRNLVVLSNVDGEVALKN